MTTTSSKGIIGTKLGMTQLFDEESGRVTPVTVIEAGPCPVVAVRTPGVDGYSAVQLAYRPCKEKKLSRPRAGHLKAAGVGPHRTLVEFRNAGEGLTPGDTVTVDAFAPGEPVKVSGVRMAAAAGAADTSSATARASAVVRRDARDDERDIRPRSLVGQLPGGLFARRVAPPTAGESPCHDTRRNLQLPGVVLLVRGLLVQPPVARARWGQ